MVEEQVTDGRRIAQLFASEIRGHQRNALGYCSVVDIQDVDGTDTGEYAYGINIGDNMSDETYGRLADVFVHTHRARVEFRLCVDTAVAAAHEAGLRVRPKAAKPPGTVVFVESGVEAKRIVPVFRAVASERRSTENA
jgi:hypothetical protein